MSRCSSCLVWVTLVIVSLVFGELSRSRGWRVRVGVICTSRALGVVVELVNLLVCVISLVCLVVVGVVGIMLWFVVMVVRLSALLSVIGYRSWIWWLVNTNYNVRVYEHRWRLEVIVAGRWFSS